MSKVKVHRTFEIEYEWTEEEMTEGTTLDDALAYEQTVDSMYGVAFQKVGAMRQVGVRVWRE